MPCSCCSTRLAWYQYAAKGSVLGSALLAVICNRADACADMIERQRGGRLLQLVLVSRFHLTTTTLPAPASRFLSGLLPCWPFAIIREHPLSHLSTLHWSYFCSAHGALLRSLAKLVFCLHLPALTTLLPQRSVVSKRKLLFSFMLKPCKAL